MSTAELACTYAALILNDDNVPVTADKINALLKAANVTVEPFWPTLFAKMLKTKNINDLISNVGGGSAVAAPVAATNAPAAGKKEEPKKEAAKEESDEELGLSLFD